MSDSAGNPIKAVDTAMDVLEALRELNGANLTAVARYLEKPKSTVHRHLKTLQDHRLVTEEDGTYYVGLRFLEIGSYARNRRPFYSVAKPLVDDLAQETQESCHIAVEEHGRAVYLYYARSGKGVKTDAHPGIPLYMHCTATGKALLAHLPESYVDEIIDRHGLPKKTENTITDRNTLHEELAAIRDRGIAFGDEERLSGMRGVAAPILEKDERSLVGVLTIAGPTKRVHGSRFTDELPELLKQTTQMIEVEMSYGSDQASSYLIDELADTLDENR